MEEDGISAKAAAQRLAEGWQMKGVRPVTDEIKQSTNKVVTSVKVGLLKPRIKESLNNVNKNTWKKVRFCLDSGAGETVMAEVMEAP